MNAKFSDSSSEESRFSDASESSGDIFMEICTISIALSEQEVKCHCVQLAWDDHVTSLMHEKQFDVKYHTSYDSFMHLVVLLEPCLAQNMRKVSIVVAN